MKHFSTSQTQQQRDELDARAKAIQEADPSKTYTDALAEADAEFRSKSTGQFSDSETPAHLQQGYVHGKGTQGTGKRSAAFSGVQLMNEANAILAAARADLERFKAKQHHAPSKGSSFTPTRR